MFFEPFLAEEVEFFAYCSPSFASCSDGKNDSPARRPNSASEPQPSAPQGSHQADT